LNTGEKIKLKRPHPRSAVKNWQHRAAMRWPSLSYGTLPIIILLLTFTASLIGYGFASAQVESSRKISIERTLRENVLRSDNFFNSYAHVLWGSSGHVQSSGSTDKNSWQNFMSVYDIEKNFKGIEAVGLVQGSQLTDMTISYVTPETPDTMQAVGINIGQQDMLQGTMRKAAVSGLTVVSDPVPDLFSTKNDVTSTKTGFLMFAPYYDSSMPLETEDERLAAIRGYTVGLFRGDIFYNNVFGSVDMSHKRVKVYLGEPEERNLLNKSGTTTTNNLRYATQQVDEYGKVLTYQFTFDAQYVLSWSLTYYPVILLVSCLVLGMLFAGVSGYMLRSRYHRLTYEKERDVNFAKDELLSLASHQLRTPATGVKQYLGMVLQGFAGDLSDQQRTYLDRAYASNNRQLHVINDILHLAKLEAGRIVLAEHEFNIAEMIKEIVEEQQDEATKGDIALTYKGPVKGLMVGDAHMLRMVVENLVSNGIKYTPPNGKVSVRLSRLANQWVITVKDTGVGIARTDFSKLFKQFSRIENTRSEIVTGTGIGLYLAHHLTLLHGGTIGVSSSKGKGSTFTIRLPRKM